MLAAIIRAYALDAPFNTEDIDEIIQFNASSRSIDRIISNELSPLSKVFAHYALKLESSERALRLPSFMAGIIGVWLMYLLGAQAGGRRATGIIAAFFLAISAFHVEHSQWGRYYSLVCAFWLMQTIAVILFARRVWYAGLIYLIATYCGAITHPFFVVYSVAGLAGAMLYLVMSQDNARSGESRFWRAVILGLLFSISISGLALELFDSAEQLTTTSPATSSEYQLTVQQYWSLLRDMMFPYPLPVQIIWLGTAAYGLFRLWGECRVLVFIFLPCLFLVPIPFLLRPVTHSYNSNYFIINLPIFLMCISVALSDLLFRTKNILKSRNNLPNAANNTNQMPILGRIGISVATVLLFCFITWYSIAFLAHAIQIQLKKFERNKWPAIAERIVPYLNNSDWVIHYGPSRYGNKTTDRSHRLLGYYIQAKARPEFADVTQTYRVYTADYSEVFSAAFGNPFSNIWVLQWFKEQNPLGPSHNSPFENLFNTEVKAVQLQLRSRGAPTSNMVINGGFEQNVDTKSWRNSEIVNTAYAGNRALRLAVNKPGNNAVAEIPLKLKSQPVRNKSFNLVEDAAPLGWTIKGLKDKLLLTIGQAGEKNALTLKGNPVPVRLSQNVDGEDLVGAAVTLSCIAQAGQSSPTVRLVYERADGPKEFIEVTTVKEVSCGWARYSATARVAKDAYKDSFRLEIIGPSDVNSAFILDEVDLSVTDATSLFRSGKPYWFSAALKADRLHSGYTTYNDRDLLQFRIVGRDNKGRRVEHKIKGLAGNFDWDLFTFPIETPQIRNLKNAKLQISLSGGTGTVWIDNLQIEQNTHATPFVNGDRLPHDEAFAAFGWYPNGVHELEIRNGSFEELAASKQDLVPVEGWISYTRDRAPWGTVEVVPSPCGAGNAVSLAHTSEDGWGSVILQRYESKRLDSLVGDKIQFTAYAWSDNIDDIFARINISTTDSQSREIDMEKLQLSSNMYLLNCEIRVKPNHKYFEIHLGALGADPVMFDNVTAIAVQD